MDDDYDPNVSGGGSRGSTSLPKFNHLYPVLELVRERGVVHVELSVNWGSVVVNKTVGPIQQSLPSLRRCKRPRHDRQQSPAPAAKKACPSTVEVIDLVTGSDGYVSFFTDSDQGE